jgi:ankyrin repeat protein
MKPMILAAALVSATVSPAAESIHQAFANGPDETLLDLVKNNPALIEEKDDSQCTALHYAARYGRLKTATWLIEHKADVNTVAYNKFTPMHVVTDGAVATFLIKSGADLKARDAWNKTPLQSAAQMGYTNVCEAILASGSPIDLSSALRLGKRGLVKKMLQEKPSIAKEVEEDSDLWGNTSPLGVAAAQGDKEIVELLLNADAPVNAVTERPNGGPTTALCNAVWARHYEIAEILCKAGADCNMSGGKFYPRLLDYAFDHSDKRTINLLIKHGAKSSANQRSHEWVLRVGYRAFGLVGYSSARSNTVPASTEIYCGAPVGSSNYWHVNQPIHLVAAMLAAIANIPIVAAAIYFRRRRRTTR